uniref:Trehalase n=1 Tax=Trichuris muris TaxID=70415 RepID=A0A5S6QXN0_TRIMR
MSVNGARLDICFRLPVVKAPKNKADVHVTGRQDAHYCLGEVEKELRSADNRKANAFEICLRTRSVVCQCLQWQGAVSIGHTFALCRIAIRRRDPLISWLLTVRPSTGAPIVDTCDIFCHGPLLDAVQRARLFKDSKYFVDMSLRHDPLVILESFIAVRNKSDPEELRRFVDANFDRPGSELEPCTPTDWTPVPKSFDVIKDPHYRFWAHTINQKWLVLCRMVKKEVHKNPDHYSLIAVKRPFIVPGGRFLEYYYWDTYWILKGLLASGMYTTAKDMILNLASMVERFGFVPNGGRIYYLNRSQPPFLTACVYDYYNATKDLGLVQFALPLLEKEYQFWVRERTVPFKNGDDEPIRLYQYKAKADRPRSESYREDMEITENLPDQKARQQLWDDITSACESGWDFTSRWFGSSGPYRNTLRSIRTTRVVPVDLNAFMCANDHMLSKMYEAVGDAEMADEHRRNYETSKQVMKKIFWDPDDNIWYDVDLETGKRAPTYYPSNAVPLYSQCFNDSEDELGEMVSKYLEKTGVLNVPYGLPSSLLWTDEQWDRPNGWAPIQHMIIEGLRRSTNADVQETAFQIAKKWLELNYRVFLRTGGKMFEKYNVENGYSPGGGGEYDVQEGFGWTNGVVLDLLITYGDRLSVPVAPAKPAV